MGKYLVLILLFVSHILISQSDSIVDQLEEIVIQENRISLPFSDISRSISVISSAQIENANARDVAELLTMVGGIDVRQRGVHGVQSDIGIRGGTFDQTLILLNGVKLIDPQTGHHSMNIPVNLNVIERIEIIKGPAARIYGQNGFSGAINIVTKKGEDDLISFGIRYGSHNSIGLSLTETLSTKRSNHIVSLNRNTSDGYKYNTDYRVENIFYQNNIDLGQHELNLTLGHSWREFGANGFYASPDFMDQFEEISTTIANAGFKLNFNDWMVNPRFTYRKNIDHYIFVRDNPAIYENNHTGESYLAEINARKFNKFGAFGIGMEFNAFNLESNNLGDRQRNLWSFMLEQRFVLFDGQIDVTPGVSYTVYSDFDNRFFPGIDVGYKLNDNLKLFGNYGYTYRVPTYTDRFYSDPSNKGNPNLQPEQAVAHELGIKYNDKSFCGSVSYFERNGSDLIDWVKDVDTLQWEPINIGSIRTRGFDIELGYTFSENSILKSASMGYVLINADQSDVASQFSRYALEHLNNQFVASLNWSYANFHHSLSFRYLDRENLDDYAILDTRFSYRTKKADAFLSVDNVFNTNYMETNLVTMPGRWITLGLNYHLYY